MMEKAIFSDKKNPLPKYQKALILVGLQKYQEALDELERLREIAPHESSMYGLYPIYAFLNRNLFPPSHASCPPSCQNATALAAATFRESTPLAMGIRTL